MVSMSGLFEVKMLEIMKILNRCALRKGWTFNLSALCLIFHNKMAKWNENFLPCLIRCMLYLTVGFFLFLRNGLSAAMAKTVMLLENNLLTPSWNLSPFQFWKRKWRLLTLVQDFGCNNSHHAKLANQGTPGIWVSFADGYSVITYHLFSPPT